MENVPSKSLNGTFWVGHLIQILIATAGNKSPLKRGYIPQQILIKAEHYNVQNFDLKLQ